MAEVAWAMQRLLIGKLLSAFLGLAVVKALITQCPDSMPDLLSHPCVASYLG